MGSCKEQHIHLIECSRCHCDRWPADISSQWGIRITGQHLWERVWFFGFTYKLIRLTLFCLNSCFMCTWTFSTHMAVVLQFARFTKRAPPVRLTQERPKCALHHGKMSTNKCRARYEITHEHVSNDLKMWIKRLHTEIHNIITIYIHYKSIYFKIITCIILGLVNSNVFACKTMSAFNDFVDSFVTGKRNRTGARAL